MSYSKQTLATSQKHIFTSSSFVADYDKYLVSTRFNSDTKPKEGCKTYKVNVLSSVNVNEINILTTSTFIWKTVSFCLLYSMFKTLARTSSSGVSAAKYLAICSLLFNYDSIIVPSSFKIQTYCSPVRSALLVSVVRRSIACVFGSLAV